MLYKKYHRNFIREFKKGTVFRWNMFRCNGSRKVDIVRREPYYDNINRWICVTGSKYDLVLITDGGQLIKHDVI